VLTYQEFGPYGTQTTFYFALEDVTDAEAPFTGVAPLTGDIWVSKDGGAAANATNAFAAISNGFYSWTATASEMTAGRILVNVYDATASAIFKPIAIRIITRLSIGQFAIDATNLGSSAVGFGVIGHGSAVYFQAGAAAVSHGLYAVGGTNDASCSGIFAQGGSAGGAAVNLLGLTTGPAINAQGGSSGHGIIATAGGSGNGHGIFGTGKGSGAGVAGLGGNTSGSGFGGVGGTGGTGIAGQAGAGGALCNLFDTVLTSEPTAAFAATDTYGKSIARLVRRFYNKVTQTSSQQKQYRDDNTTVVDTMTVSDDATTQTKGKSA